MTTQSCNSQVSTVGSKPERILRYSNAATADSKPKNGADFSTHLARARSADDLRRDNLDVLPKKPWVNT